MKNNFPHVFSPLTVRGMTLKNRVVMMPMGSDFAGHDGELSDEHIKYYELRARGGNRNAAIKMITLIRNVLFFSENTLFSAILFSILSVSFSKG